MRYYLSLFFGFALQLAVAGPAYFDPTKIPQRDQVLNCDVCIYGGTSAAVVALLESSRLGLNAVLLNNGDYFGGMTASGLSATDFGMTSTIGGLAREFYRRVGARYGTSEEWYFEPKVAAAVFQDMLAEAKQTVLTQAWIAGVTKTNAHIEEIQCIGGLRVRAKYYIDCSYEGDLMAKAGIDYTIGRESNSVYGEADNGEQVRSGHQFTVNVDPYNIPGVPGSGLLPGIETGGRQAGAGDNRLQAYNFRLCLTKLAANRAEFEKPQDYDPDLYILLSRYLAANSNPVLWNPVNIRNSKTDTNNNGPISTDYIGGNTGFVTASYEDREQIYRKHVTYLKGWLWFLQHDTSVPIGIHSEFSQWGLAKDEFVETNNWPPLLYIREARRMVGDKVVTEDICNRREVVPDPVALGSYTMDSHNCDRFVQGGFVRNEGDVQIAVSRPYGIPYRALLPKRGQADNLLVPVCLSASHIAYGSIRMEPVYMMLGQSAAIACYIANRENTALREIPYGMLRAILVGRQQIIDVASINNIKARNEISSESPLILGCFIQGGPATTLFRGAGPSLQQFGVTNPASNTALRAFDSRGTLLAQTFGTFDKTTLDATTFAGAFPLLHPDVEASISAALATGTYTCVVGTGDAVAGQVLAEAYLIDTTTQPKASFSNIATRASLKPHSEVKVECTIGGAGQGRVLVRAAGPSLRHFGIGDAVGSAKLTVVNSQGVLLAMNNGWGKFVEVAAGKDITSTDLNAIRSTTSSVGAFPFDDNSLDSDLLMRLEPGTYTLHASNETDVSGTILVEVYDADFADFRRQ